MLNCNKIKELKISVDDIVKAVTNSDKLEINPDNKKVRRTGNPPLPDKTAKNGVDGAKKREVKAADKEESKTEAAPEKVEEDEVDDKGNPVLCGQDFENPMIIHFKTADTSDPAFKV